MNTLRQYAPALDAPEFPCPLTLGRPLFSPINAQIDLLKTLQKIMSSAMSIDDIIDNFDLLDDWEDKYRYLIELGSALPA
jgi:hypothetical protein